MIPHLKISKALREVNSPGVTEQLTEVRWPSAVAAAPKNQGSSAFFDLLAHHRQSFVTGGHKGLSGRQRKVNRRQAWKKHLKK